MSNPAAKDEPLVAVPPKSKKKLALTIALASVAIAVGAIRFFAQDHVPARGHAETAGVEVSHEATFVPLGENFTVNLRGEDGKEGDQYLQAGITLKVMQPELAAKIKAALPEIRDKLALLLSRKKPSELQTAEGKTNLVAEIIAQTDAELGLGTLPVNAPAPQAAQDNAASSPASALVAAAQAAAAAPKTAGVTDVQFTSFIIQ